LNHEGAKDAKKIWRVSHRDTEVTEEETMYEPREEAFLP
jgi:hypothetical protein